MSARTWGINDPIVEHVDGIYHLGTVVGVDAHLLAIRFDDGDRAAFRDRRSPFLHDPDDIPIDARHWVPESVQDQLVRQEAAGRLRAMAGELDVLGHRFTSAELYELALDLEDLLNAAPVLAAAARALITPAPQMATTP